MSTFKQERDKAAKEGRQEGASKGSLQFIHEGQIVWGIFVGREGVCSAPPLTSVAGLMCAYADEINGFHTGNRS